VFLACGGGDHMVHVISIAEAQVVSLLRGMCIDLCCCSGCWQQPVSQQRGLTHANGWVGVGMMHTGHKAEIVDITTHTSDSHELVLSASKDQSIRVWDWISESCLACVDIDVSCMVCTVIQSGTCVAMQMSTTLLY
jgi:WD40 repeat protein